MRTSRQARPIFAPAVSLVLVAAPLRAAHEESGGSTVTGRAKATAKEIADVLKPRFQEQGWIE